MREILFKAKRIDNDEWVEGWYDGCYSTVTINYLENGYAYNVRVDPETVCQYTGVLDKNGGRIFEGDVVKTDDVIHDGKIQICGQKLKVMFYIGCFALFTGNNLFYDYIHTKEKTEVISNIHNKQDREDYGLNE